MSDEIKKGFEEMDQRFDTVLDAIQTRFTKVDTSIEDLALATQMGFEAVDKRFDAMDVRYDSLEGKFDGLIHRMDSFESRMDRRHADFMEWMRIHTMRASDMYDRTDRLEGRISRLEA